MPVNSKLMNLEEALDMVQDGRMVALGGMTLYRKPMAAVREIIRRQRRDLRLVSYAGSIDVDMLIGAGCVGQVRTCYTGMEFMGLAPNFRRFVEKNEVNLMEETELTMAGGLAAAQQLSPFYATKQLLGTEILKVRQDIVVLPSPFTGEPTVCIPPLKPDIAIIHVQRSDKFGNAQVEGQLCMDKELSAVSDRVILTTEKIVSTEEIVNSPAKAQIIGANVDAVVKVPFGAHPTSCYPFYTYDVPHMLQYLRSSGEGRLDTYLKDYVFDKYTQAGYLERAGGVENLLGILY